MNAVTIVLCTLLVAVNAGVTLHHAIPAVVHHEVHAVPVVHAPVVTRVVPAAHSSSFSYRAPAAKLAVPIVHHTPIVAHHTPIVAHHQLHHVSPIVMHHIAASPIFLH